jgi:hypothetical protein
MTLHGKIAKYPEKVPNLAGSAILANKDILCVTYIVSLYYYIKNLQLKHTLILAVFLPYICIPYFVSFLHSILNSPTICFPKFMLLHASKPLLPHRILPFNAGI